MIAKKPEDRPATASAVARAATALRRGDVAGAAAIVPAIAGGLAMDEATKLLTPGLATQEATRLLPTAGAAGAVAAVDAADEPQKKKRSPWTWPLVALIALLLIVLGGTLFALFANQGAQPAPTTSSSTSSTPSRSATPPSPSASPTTVAIDSLQLIGKTCDEAQTAAKAAKVDVTCERGSAAPSQDQVGKIYQTNPTRGDVPLGTIITVTFYDEMSPIGTPNPPTVTNDPKGSQTFTVTWEAFSGCPAGSSVTAYNFTVINGTFNANNSTTYQSPTAPRSLQVTADKNVQPGSLILVKYSAQCGDRTSPDSQEGQAPIPTTSTPTGTPVAP